MVRFTHIGSLAGSGQLEAPRITPRGHAKHDRLEASRMPRKHRERRPGHVRKSAEARGIGHRARAPGRYGHATRAQNGRPRHLGREEECSRNSLAAELRYKFQGSPRRYGALAFSLNCLRDLAAQVLLCEIGTAQRAERGAGAAYRFSPSQKPLPLLLLDRPLVVPSQRLQRFLVAGNLPVNGRTLRLPRLHAPEGWGWREAVLACAGGGWRFF